MVQKRTDFCKLLSGFHTHTHTHVYSLTYTHSKQINVIKIKNENKSRETGRNEGSMVGQAESVLH